MHHHIPDMGARMQTPTRTHTHINHQYGTKFCPASVIRRGEEEADFYDADEEPECVSTHTHTWCTTTRAVDKNELSREEGGGGGGSAFR